MNIKKYKELAPNTLNKDLTYTGKFKLHLNQLLLKRV